MRLEDFQHYFALARDCGAALARRALAWLQSAWRFVKRCLRPPSDADIAAALKRMAAHAQQAQKDQVRRAAARGVKADGGNATSTEAKPTASTEAPASVAPTPSAETEDTVRWRRRPPPLVRSLVPVVARIVLHKVSPRERGRTIAALWPGLT